MILSVSDAVTGADLQAWVAGLDALFARVSGRFGRVEPRRRARAYLSGLLAPVERKNGWQLAEAAGEATPDGMQRLLNNARWDPRQVRDDLRAYVVENLGHPGGVLIVDETPPLRRYGDFDYDAIMFQLSRLSREKLRGALDEAQCRELTLRFDQARRMESILVSEGYLRREKAPAPSGAGASRDHGERGGEKAAYARGSRVGDGSP